MPSRNARCGAVRGSGPTRSEEGESPTIPIRYAIRAGWAEPTQTNPRTPTAKPLMNNRRFIMPSPRWPVEVEAPGYQPSNAMLRQLLRSKEVEMVEDGYGSKRATGTLSVAGVNPTSHQCSMAAVCHFETWIIGGAAG